MTAVLSPFRIKGQRQEKKHNKFFGLIFLLVISTVNLHGQIQKLTSASSFSSDANTTLGLSRYKWDFFSFRRALTLQPPSGTRRSAEEHKKSWRHQDYLNRSLSRFKKGLRAVPKQMRRFATTHWSLVLTARQHTTPAGREALSVLCEKYWYPIYSCVRRKGFDVATAEDLTQGFFATLLEKHYVDGARPERGRFRVFLLTALAHYLADEPDREHAQKRGGGRNPVQWGLEEAENRYAFEPTDGRSPDKVYEKNWALAILQHAANELRKKYAARSQRELFEKLKGFLAGGQADKSYRELAGELQMSEAALKFTIHQLRRRFRNLVRAEIAQTLADPAEMDAEMEFLFQTLRE